MSRILYVVALALVAVVLSPAGAHAQRWSGTDAEADVTAWEHDPGVEPCGEWTDRSDLENSSGDVVELKVRHTNRFLFLSVRVRDLVPGAEVDVTFDVWSKGRRSQVDLGRSPRRGEVRTSAFVYGDIAFSEPEGECDGGSSVASGLCRARGTSDDAADLLVARVRRSCLGRPSWVRVGAATYGFGSEPSPGVITGWGDEWGVRTEDLGVFDRPTSPRVRAPEGAPTGSTRRAGTMTTDVVLPAHRAVVLPRH